jgi:hypothetical protein
MALKKRQPSRPTNKAVTPERAARLYRLLKILGNGPQSRQALVRRLRIDIRGFYRDLELLRAAEIHVPLVERKYRLRDPLKVAIARLPFPDPRLSLGEAITLARGRTAIHRRIRSLITRILK